MHIYEAHPTLFHYTSFEGLEGMLRNHNLWATHYRSLNDFSEVEHMRSFLESKVYPIVNGQMRKMARESFKYRRYIDKHRGLYRCSKSEASKIVDILYHVTFEGRESSGLGAFSEPYIVSFCAHTDQDEYVRTNGLLSMWRAYGNQGGYALVFDTEKLWNLLAREREAFHYTSFSFGDVVYDNQSENFDEEFGELVRAIEKFLAEHIELEKGKSEQDTGYLFLPFFDSVTRFKHQGFAEESEVRIVVSPVSGSLAERTAEIDKDAKIQEKAIKPILTRERSGLEVPYIELNKLDDAVRLPVTKIIVGPQHDQNSKAENIRALVGSDIEIVCSETPFIPV